MLVFVAMEWLFFFGNGDKTGITHKAKRIKLQERESREQVHE